MHRRNRKELTSDIVTVTGTKTKKGSFTYTGSAEADDPIYKEGWHIHLPKSEPKSKDPSTSTPPKQR